MMRIHTMIGVLLFLAFQFATNQAAAQYDKDENGGTFRKQLASELHEMRARVLREKIGLDEETSARSEKLFNHYDKKHRQKRIVILKKAKQLKEMIELDDDNQKAYASLVEEIADTHKKMKEIRQKEFEELRKILTPKQQAKLLLELPNIKKQVAEIIKAAFHKKIIEAEIDAAENEYDDFDF